MPIKSRNSSPLQEVQVENINELKKVLNKFLDEKPNWIIKGLLTIQLTIELIIQSLIGLLECLRVTSSPLETI